MNKLTKILLFLLVCASAIAANPVAISMRYVVIQDRSKHITLSAFSDNIEWNLHTYLDYPTIDWSTRYKAYRMGGAAGSRISGGILRGGTLR